MACGDQSCSLRALNVTSIGEPINNIRRSVYESLIMYYGNPTMYKVESPNHMYSMYVVEVACFCADKRYLIAVCRPDNKGFGTPVPLSQLQWISFQARVSPTNYQVPKVHFEGVSTLFTQSEIRQMPNENNIATYMVTGYPVKVQLLGNSMYRDTGSVSEALETYTTVLFFE
jgi:hypothetical protein